MTELHKFLPNVSLPIDTGEDTYQKSIIYPDKSIVKSKEMVSVDHDFMQPTTQPAFTTLADRKFDMTGTGHKFITGYTLHIKWVTDGVNTPTARKLLALTLINNISVKIGQKTNVNVPGYTLLDFLVDQAPNKETIDKYISFLGGDAFTFSGSAGVVYEFFVPLIFVPGFNVPPHFADTECYPIYLHEDKKIPFEINIKTEAIANCFSTGTAVAPTTFELQYRYFDVDDKYITTNNYKSIWYVPVSASIPVTTTTTTALVECKLGGIKNNNSEAQKIFVRPILTTDLNAYNYFNTVDLKWVEFKNGGNKILEKWETLAQYDYYIWERKARYSTYTIGSTTYNTFQQTNASPHSSYNDMTQFVTNGFVPGKIQEYSAYINTGAATTSYNLLAIALYKNEIHISPGKVEIIE